MLNIKTTERWHQTFAGGAVGVLLVGNVDNSQPAPALTDPKRAIEAKLREKFGELSRKQLLQNEVLAAYQRYYKRFNKTYHVQLQLESIVNKGKSLPNVSPLVDVNFMAELETLTLAAGHDADLLANPIVIDASQGDESFTQMNGNERPLKANDMMMSDAKGVICTIIYGQDRRTPISKTTRRALYVVYAPAGVPQTAVQQQLTLVWQHIQRFAPSAKQELQQIFTA